MIGVTGSRTTIVRELERSNRLYGGKLFGRAVRIGGDLSQLNATFEIPPADRFVLAAGVLHGKRIRDQSADEIMSTIAVNMVNVVRLCDQILEERSAARICIIGSESGYRGSYDDTYAISKAAVHSYVQMKKVQPGQQLVAVAPHIMLDSGMTQRRADYQALASNGRRYIRPDEVADMIRALLWSEWPWVNNAVIRMAG